MKHKYLLYVMSAVLLLLTVLLLSIPRVDAVWSVPVQMMGEYPALQEAYDHLSEERGLWEIVTEDTIRIVTVKNLWGSWDRYILPCYAAKTPAVPTAGNATFNMFMHVLSPWSEENLFTRLCPAKLTLNVSMIPGENTFVSERVEATPVPAATLDDHVVLDGSINCDREPSVFVYYTVATHSSALERDKTVIGTFEWTYFLKLCGKEIFFNEFTINQEYTVNA